MVLVKIIQFLEHLQIILEEAEAERILEAEVLRIGLAAQQEMIVPVLVADPQILRQAMEAMEPPIVAERAAVLALMEAEELATAAMEVAELWLSAI